MKIQLKEAEVAAAVRQYIVSQGINLAGKTIDIAFIATRSGAGTVAEINIEEASDAIPGFTNEAADEPEPAPTRGSVVPVPVVALAAVKEEAKKESKPEAKETAQVVAEAEAAALNDGLDKPVAKTSSLFS